MGAIGTVVHYAILIAMVTTRTAAPLPASAVAFTAGAGVNYLLNYRFTFASRKRHVEAAGKFYVVAMCGLAINSGVMAVGVNLLGVHYLATQLAATAIVLVWNFVANRAWTFRETRSVETR